MSEPFAEQQQVVEGDTTSLGVEPSLVLDEDRLGADPLEDGMDTAEDYSRAVKLGNAPGDEAQDTLAYRIPQEEPDVAAEVPPEVPVAVTPALDLDESVDDPANSVDGVGAAGIEDPLAVDGATEAERLTEGDADIQLGLSSAPGANEETGLPADSGIGEAAGIDRENPGAEAQALHVEQES